MKKLAAVLALAALAACDQGGGGSPLGGLGQHRLVGTSYEDKSSEDGFEMAFISKEAVELRLFNKTKISECAWTDVTADAKARGESTTVRIVEQGQYSAPKVISTGAPASFRIQVTCQRPLGSGQLRFEMVFAEDLNSATRLEQVHNLGAELFGYGGRYDVGRTVTRVGVTQQAFTPSDAAPLFGAWRSTAKNERCPKFLAFNEREGTLDLINSSDGNNFTEMAFENVRAESRDPLVLSGEHGRDMVIQFAARNGGLHLSASDGLSCAYERWRN